MSTCANSRGTNANIFHNEECIRSLWLPCIFILLNNSQASLSGKDPAPISLSNIITPKSQKHFSLLYANRRTHIIILVRVNKQMHPNTCQGLLTHLSVTEECRVLHLDFTLQRRLQDTKSNQGMEQSRLNRRKSLLLANRNQRGSLQMAKARHHMKPS